MLGFLAGTILRPLALLWRLPHPASRPNPIPLSQMKKATLPKINGTLPAKMLAALCVLNCVGALTPPAEESALETKSTAAAPSLKNCVALETKCKKKDLWEVTKSCGVEELEKKYHAQKKMITDAAADRKQYLGTKILESRKT